MTNDYNRLRKARRHYDMVRNGEGATFYQKSEARQNYLDTLREVVGKTNPWGIVRRPDPAIGMNMETATGTPGRTVNVDPSLPRRDVPATTLHEIVEEIAQEPESSRMVAHREANEAERAVFGDAATDMGKRDVDQLASIEGQDTGVEFNENKGKYTLYKSNFHGIPLDVEYRKGDIREGQSQTGKKWRRVMRNEYGNIRRTEGADGEEIDYYMGPNPDSKKVYVVNQIDQDTGRFDEHKLMLGFDSESSAKASYKKHYPPGWRVGPISEKDIDWLRGWMRSNRTDYIVKAVWDESRHPRDESGRFSPLDGGGAGSDSEWLKTSGAVRSMPDNMPKKFTRELAKTLKRANSMYPSLKVKDVKVVPGKDQFMGMRYGNLEVSQGLLDNMDAYGLANEFQSTLQPEAYSKFTANQIDGYLKRDRFSPEAKNLSNALKLMATGDADQPESQYVASSIGDMLWHELGHMALSSARMQAEKLVPGLDNGGVSYQLLGEDDMKSAMRLSHYAAQAAEEYAAEAWCAHHTGRTELLDDRAKKLVESMVTAASRHNLNT